MQNVYKREDGSLVLNPDESYINADGSVKEEFYHDEMFMQDLRLEQLDDYYWYLVDDNRDKLYQRGSYLLQNPLKDLLEDLENAPLVLLPVPDDEAESLLRAFYTEDLPYGMDETVDAFDSSFVLEQAYDYIHGDNEVEKAIETYEKEGIATVCRNGDIHTLVFDDPMILIPEEC